ncbi:acetyl-CoA carboxylase biotin carboxyl carrier protein [Nocardia aurantiaca]|uniref:Biotin carboxyl carrier protein of acetyl-CoA carboxylase n=1 Tax=Nocardia aurantiaca TaxID=2675850 RepID=A0A6I3L1R7_9NOCA|nr:biotin/lipoyl-containing protein [Nocardia aurantiaca]MTE14575.1 acetyl-CoA carboxylase biotin carboxyl carrier protein subunit [Nocardia aurantiaca]
MTDNGITAPPAATHTTSGPAAAALGSARAVSATEADHSLTVLARHALTVRAGIAPAPTSVTVANGPVVLQVGWEAGQAGNAVLTAAAAPHLPVGPAPAAPTAPGANDGKDSSAATFTLTAETVGVFYRSPEPGAAPFVAEGDPVRAGQQVAIVEAMKLMIPVTTGSEGVVAEFLVEDGESVEHGQPLIVFEVLR